VLFDTATGEPVAPMVVWSDTRGLARAAALQSEGFMVWPQTPACKLEAVLAAVPDGRARAARGGVRFGTLDTYLGYRLSGGGVFATDVSNGWASGYTDYSQAGGVWNTGLIAHQDLPAAMFPAIVDTYGVCGTTDPAVLGAAVPVAAIVADQQSGMFAHAALAPGGWKASFGTSAVVIAATGALPGTPHHTMPPQALMRAGDATSYCVEGMVITAGVLLDWLSHGLGMFADSASLCTAASAGSAGVAIRPSLQGLGAPHGVLGARGVMAGVSPGTDRAAIARAALEGVAFRTAEIVALMRGAGIGGTALPVDGGIATSDLFCQIVADLCQVPVRRHAVREGAAYGAAVAAALGADLVALDDLPAFARYDRAFEPFFSADEATASATAWRTALAG
jgi:glycerol kinase